MQLRRRAEGVRGGRVGSDGPVGRGPVDVRRKPRHPVGGMGVLLHVAALVALVGVVVTVVVHERARMPPVVPDRVDTQDTFSEERARVHLAHLSETIGARVVGTPANEATTSYYVLNTLQEMLWQEGLPKLSVEIKAQVGSGAFYIDFLGGFTNVYDSVGNVIVRVTNWEDAEGAGSKANTLMLSSHYDTAVSSPGAGDAGTGISVMLETLRTVVARGEPLKHGLIFVFGGAEETILQSSHAFVTLHHWFDSIRCFINMDAAGVGGKELLFQVGPHHYWLAEHYAKNAPHPFGNVVGQDLFASGAIPSDTDFRIYDQVGHLPGLDFAHVTQGYVYHTSRDSYDRVEPGCLQRMGENIVATVRSLVLPDAPMETDVLTALEEDTTNVNAYAVYYDLLGMTMFCYSLTSATIVNTAVAAYAAVVLVLYTRGKQHRLLSNLGMAAACVGGGIGASVAAGALLHAAHLRMTWYAQGHAGLVRLFLPFAVLGVVGALHMWTRRRLAEQQPRVRVSAAKKEKMSPVASRVSAPVVPTSATAELDIVHDYLLGAFTLWLVLLCLGTFGGVGSTYVAAWWVAFGGMALHAAHVFGVDLVGRDGNSAWPVLWALGGAVPLLVMVDVVYGMVVFFTPILGRAGDLAPTDVVASLLGGALITLVLLVPLVLLHRIGRRRAVLAVLLLLCVAGAVESASHFPYSFDHPKRLFVQHVVPAKGERDSHGSRGRVVMAGIDGLPADFVAAHSREVRARGGSRGDTSSMGFLFPMSRIMTTSHVVPAQHDPPKFVEPRIDVLKREGQRVHVGVQLGSGMATMTITGDITGWSFTPELPPKHEPEGFYFVRFATGVLQEREWTFWLDKESDAAVRLTVQGHYTTSLSDDLVELGNDLPEWVALFPWMSTEATTVV